jgi:hypothetical protein
MALANVALTDTFDYWRTVTNSTVVALNDKLIFCNTSNANTVSIPSFASRSSNLTINILTSSSVNDSASGNIASALVVNTVHGLAISYVTAANSNAQISVASANAWSNAVNTYSIATYATKISPTFTGTVTIDANIANQTLTDGSTINWDVSLGSVATVTLGGSRTMAAPTNLKIGTYILHVVQDGSGGRSLTWNSVFKWPAGVAPTLTSTANRRDLFSFVCDGTNLYGSYLPDVR